MDIKIEADLVDGAVEIKVADMVLDRITKGWTIEEENVTPIVAEWFRKRLVYHEEDEQE